MINLLQILKLKLIVETTILTITLQFIFGVSFCEDRTKSDTLAVIGDKIITNEYFINYYKDKVLRLGLSDNGETRVGFLKNIVNDELLISEAKNSGIDKTAAAKKEFERIYLQELLNAYTEKYISPTVKVTEDDLLKIFRRFNTKVKVSHLYAPTKSEAETLYKKVLNGESFEKLAGEVFEDPKLKNSGGSLGYISVDEMDPDFEEAAFSMRIGEVSQPIKTVQGYSIIRVEDIKNNPLLTENEFLKNQTKLKAFARKRKFEEASKLFAQSLREQLKITFNDELISKIYLAISGGSISSLEENSLEFMKNEMNKTVVYSELGSWNLKTLLQEMEFLSENQKSFIKTKENLEDIIAGLVNRKWIAQVAVKENLDKTYAFTSNLEYKFNTYLLTAMEDKLKAQVLISPEAVKDYYENNTGQFQTEPKIRLSCILLNDFFIADSIRILLEEGNSFEVLAKKYSNQTFTAESGGDMGFFKRSELDDLADELFALEIGQWAGPFNNSGKIVFLKCTDKIEPVTKSFENVKEEIQKNLAEFEWYRMKDKYLEKLKNEIAVELYPQKVFELKF